MIPKPQPVKARRPIVPSRGCQTPRCPGQLRVLRRKNCSDHITRRLVCELCGLRITSIEKIVEGTTTPKARAAAIKQLAARRRGIVIKPIKKQP